MEKELHETQPASVPMPYPEVAAAMPTKMHPLPSSGFPASIPTWIIVVLLIFFPPLAWYFMWKEAGYHRWFPILLWLYGLLSLILFSLIVFLIYPQLNNLYESLEVERENAWLPYVAYVAIGVGVCEILFGFFLYRKTRNKTALPKKFLIITILILFYQWVTVPVWAVVTQMSVIAPIYMLTSSIGSESTSTPKPTTPSPALSATANWKTYTNSTYGFSLNYPDDWVVTELKDDNNDTNMILAVSPEGEEIDGLDVIKLFLYENPKRLSLAEYSEELNKNNDSGDPVNIVSSNDEKMLMSDGTQVYYQKEHYCVAVCQRYTWQKDDKVYMLIKSAGLAPGKKASPLDDIFSQVISTFNFTK